MGNDGKIVGYNTHRLNKDDECCLPEIIMVDEFNKHIGEAGKGIHHLESLINVPNKKMTERDIKVTMSMVQWFATNCGRAFYEGFNSRTVRELKEMYKSKQISRIENNANYRLETITNAFCNKKDKTEADYLVFTAKIGEVFENKKEEIKSIPDAY